MSRSVGGVPNNVPSADLRQYTPDQSIAGQPVPVLFSTLLMGGAVR